MRAGGNMLTYIMGHHVFFLLINMVGIHNLRGSNPNFFETLDFEIAVDQKERNCDRNFEGVQTPNAE